MKRQLKFRWYNYLAVLAMLMFAAMGTTYAQAGQGNGKAQQFTLCDKDGDGFISNSECQNAWFSDYDKDGDGKLNEEEYGILKQQQNNQWANRNANRPNRGKGMKKGGGNGQRLRNCSGSGTPQKLRDGSGSGRQMNGNNRSGNGRGRRG